MTVFISCVIVLKFPCTIFVWIIMNFTTISSNITCLESSVQCFLRMPRQHQPLAAVAARLDHAARRQHLGHLRGRRLARAPAALFVLVALQYLFSRRFGFLRLVAQRSLVLWLGCFLGRPLRRTDLG